MATAPPASPSCTTSDVVEHLRARALVAVVVFALAAGAFSRARLDGPVPAPCPSPALQDGIVVCDGAGEPLGASAWMFGGKLDLNTADANSLARIRGIGPSLANKIIAARDAKGSFTSLNDLDDISGVGPKMLAKLADAVEVVPPKSAPR